MAKTMKSFEYILAKLQGGALPSTLPEIANEAEDEGKDLMGAEEAKDLADKADIKQPRRQ